MARIAGVYIPDNKRVVISLTYIYGIGLVSAKRICLKAGISDQKKIKDLSNEELIDLRNIIENDYQVEGSLRREISLNIKKKKDLRSYQGLRHIKRLPVRGQNTHSNARTRKGKALAIAGKKQ